jgi:serine/threonine protein kinase
MCVCGNTRKLETLVDVTRCEATEQQDVPGPLRVHVEASLAQVRSRLEACLGGRRVQAAEAWTVDADAVDVDAWCLLGRGTTGPVYKGVFSRTPVAVKLVEGVRDAGTDSALAQDVARWARLSNANVVSLRTACLNADRPLLVTPLMQCRLATFLHKTRVAEDAAGGIVLGIAKGMAYLYSLDPPIPHGDLRAANVLVDDRGQPHVADFALARFKAAVAAAAAKANASSTTDAASPRTLPQGAVRWMAPERLKRTSTRTTTTTTTKNYNTNDDTPEVTQAADVFAWAMTAYEVLSSGNVPFSEESIDEIVKEWIKDGERPERPSGVSEALWNVVAACWHPNPGKRPAFADVVHKLERAGFQCGEAGAGGRLDSAMPPRLGECRVVKGGSVTLHACDPPSPSHTAFLLLWLGDESCAIPFQACESWYHATTRCMH